MLTSEFKALQVYCGLGGAALGFQNAVQEFKGVRGHFRNIAGLDSDPAACADYEMLTRAPVHVMDLFTRKQYIDFHGHEPPANWHEVHPEEVIFVCNNEYPDGVFLSAPCKGFSSLLPKKTSQTAKYQALNGLALRGLDLVTRAFIKNLPGLLIFENVPRVAVRGKALLDCWRRLKGAKKGGKVFVRSGMRTWVSPGGF